MSKVLAIALALVALAMSVATAGPLAKGTKFPLVSDGATPTLMRIVVARIQSDHTVDVHVWLKAPSVVPSTQEQLLIQVGEFCLRYYDEILNSAVPKEEHDRIYVFAPLYTEPAPGTNRLDQQGFAFQQEGGKCSLGPPFPANLVKTVEKRARQAIPKD